MMLRRSIPLRLMCSLAAVAGLIAAGAARTPLAAQARERTLYVSAVDSAGQPVAELGPEDFIVREDGVRREVLRVTEASEPTDVLLLVDNSAAASAAIPFMREALARFVDAMAPESRFTLIGLADRPTPLVRLTSDARQVTNAIERLFATPQTGMTLLDAIVETSGALERREVRRSVMVAVLTDGTEFTNYYARDAVRRLTDNGVPLHAVTIGRFDLSDEHSARERGFLLEGGTKTSGGQWVRLLTPHGLTDALDRVARELTSQYAVVYARPQTLIPPERVEIASARDGVVVRGAQARDNGGR